MFGFQSLIFNLFVWLAFLVPQDFEGTKTLLPIAHDEVIMTGHSQSPAIVELIPNGNQFIDTFQDTKFPQNVVFDNNQQNSLASYQPHLLYFNIGNAIDLQLSSTTIIFPFHCFT